MQSHPPFSKILHTSVRLFSVVLSRYFGRFRLFSVILAVVLAVIAVVLGYFRSFFTGDSSDKIVMTFYLKSHLFISSATSHPILRRSHHRSRHGDAPAPPMIFVFILVTSPVRARRATPRLRPFHPSPFRLRIPQTVPPLPQFHPKSRPHFSTKYLYTPLSVPPPV